MARVPLGDAGRDLTPFPYLLMLGQDDNERILGDKLRELGVRSAVEHRAGRARAGAGHRRSPRSRSPTAARELDARWVAGCDGAHSAVRELNGIDFPGAPYEHVFFVADMTMTGPMVADEVNVYLWR